MKTTSSSSSSTGSSPSVVLNLGTTRLLMSSQYDSLTKNLLSLSQSRQQSVSSSSQSLTAMKKPWALAFFPRQVVLTATRTMVLEAVCVLASYTEQLAANEVKAMNNCKEQGEEGGGDDGDADEKEIELPTMDAFFIKCTWSTIKTMVVHTVNRTLESAAIYAFDERLAKKLIKDVSRSAFRKSQRHSSAWAVSSMILKTNAHSNILYQISLLLVDQSLLLFRTIKQSIKARKAKTEAGRMAIDKEIHFWRHFFRFFLRGGSCLVMGSIGASVGTWIKPGNGTAVGFLLGDTIGNMLITG